MLAAAAIAIALGAIVVLAACGGASASESASADETFAECMSRNGVELPSPGGGPPSGDPGQMDQSAFQAAQEACADLAPQGGPGGGGPGGDGPGGPPGGAFDVEALVECLRDNGVDVPEDAEAEDLRSALDLTDPDVQEAMQACRDSQAGGDAEEPATTTTSPTL